MDVYCKKCKFSDGREVTKGRVQWFCEHPNNKASWLGPDEYIAAIHIRNKHNNCKDFTPKELDS